MDRRRFLKYAGATAAVVGASALGLNYLTEQSPSIGKQTSSTTLTPRLSTMTVSSASSGESVQLASLHGRLFFDYNGNGVQDGEEPAVAGALVQLKDYVYGKMVAETLTDSSGDYRFDDIKTNTSGLNYVYVHLGVGHLSDKRFRYLCRSPDEFRAVSDDYGVLLRESTRMDVGLMEGFLTLPFGREAEYTIGAYVDLDSGPAHMDWKSGSLTGIDNHRGIDYLMPVGQEVLAMAPGWIVEAVDNWPNNPESKDPGTGVLDTGNRITVSHGQDPYYGSLIGTHVCHLKQGILVEPRKLDYGPNAQKVRRGQVLAYSGNTGRLSFAPHLHAQVWVGRLSAEGYVDPYKALPSVRGDLSHSPNFSLWTKHNDPQHSSG